MTSSGFQLYQVEWGDWVVADGAGWVPGQYETPGAAECASGYAGDEQLLALVERVCRGEARPITMRDLQELSA